jgi:hypothetical protein
MIHSSEREEGRASVIECLLRNFLTESAQICVVFSFLCILY